MEYIAKIECEPDDTAKRIRDYLREHPEIAKGYEAERGSVRNHCYVASEAYYHASDRDDLDIYCLSHETGTHWFLRTTDGRTVIDLSLEHPSDGLGVAYNEARRRAFITGYDPSERCERVLRAVQIAI